MVMTMNDLNLNQQLAPALTGRVATRRWADDNAGAAAGFGMARNAGRVGRATKGHHAAASHWALALAATARTTARTATGGGPPRDLRGA
jgi:hypothetical protein